MNLDEIWQVDVGGQIYEASLGELAEWINEGSLLPQDKVRRGNLRWLDAIKVPALYGFFNAKDLGIAPPPMVTTTVAEAQPTTEIVQTQTENFPAALTFTHQQTGGQTNFASAEMFDPAFQTPAQDNQTEFYSPEPANACVVHNDLAPVFCCDGCGNVFCKTCPNSYGGSVKVCPMCGALCKPIEIVVESRQKTFQYHQDISAGFGFEDFGRALAYPFKFKVSLIAGAIMFMFFTLGHSAGGFGGIFMLVASLFCVMLANMLTFGVLANTVENMSQGKLFENFMPDFDDFNLWDDVVQPFFLSIGVYIVSFGLFIVIVAAGAYFAFRSIASTMAIDSTIATRQAHSQVDTAKQLEQYKQISEQIKNKQIENQQEMFDAESGAFVPHQDDSTVGQRRTGDTEENVREAQEMIDQHRQAQMESVVGPAPETQAAQQREMLKSFVGVGAPFVVLAGLALLWGLFYFPAACAVAGYTRTFSAVLNPLVGLDTIKRLGFDYVKILLMCLVLLLVSGVVSIVLGVALMAFDMPGVGNLPANALGSLFTFYFSIVFSVILGYALYKNSAKLNLYRG